MKIAAAFCAAFVVVAGAASAANAAPFTLQSLRAIVNVNDVRISPDGSKVAFVRSIGDYRHDLWNRTLVVVPAAGGPPRVLTAAMDALDDPRWSPAGTQLAYSWCRRAAGPRGKRRMWRGTSNSTRGARTAPGLPTSRRTARSNRAPPPVTTICGKCTTTAFSRSTIRDLRISGWYGRAAERRGG